MSNESVTVWLQGLRTGHNESARQILAAVYERLLGIARRRIDGQRIRWADEEDIALSAFHSFIGGAAEGKFPKLDDQDDLWKILVKITTRKAKDYLKASRRLKRGGGDVRGESVFQRPGDSNVGGIDEVAVNRPDESPELALVVAEECQRLLDQLGDPILAQISVHKMEGFTDAEIAQQLGCTTRTVERKLQGIREKWNRTLTDADDD